MANHLDQEQENNRPGSTEEMLIGRLMVEPEVDTKKKCPALNP